MLKLGEMSSSLYYFKLKEVLKVCSNPVSVIPDQMYTQIGIRSHGKGIFIKDEVTGAALGNKRVFWIEPDCFIVNIVFAWERAVARTTSDLKGFVASHRFPMYKVDPLKVDLDYFTRLFLTKKGKYLLELASPGGAGRNKTLGQKEFLNLEIQLPSLEMQKYISTFLNKLDKKIQLQQEKINLLKEQKKGFMQKIFSQELRFKDEDGQEFPEWELTSIKDIATSISYGMNAAAKPFDNKNIYIRITDINDESRKFLEHNKVSPDGTLDDKFLLENGDILFARTGASVGKSYYYEKDYRPFYFAGFLIRVRLNKNVNSHFIYQQTLTTKYSKWVQIMSMRSGQPGINAEEYGQFEILLPCKKEQDKISSFLYSLDKKIESTNKYIHELELQKQAFIQQMFI